MTDKLQKRDCLLEIISEPMPSSVQDTIWENLFEALVRNLREDWGFELKLSDVDEGYRNLVTQYRVVFVLKCLPITIPPRIIEHRGPRSNASVRAVEGFLSRWRIVFEDCEVRETKSGSFIFYSERIEGKSMSEALSKAFVGAITQLKWNKVMRFANEPAIWVRPLQRIVGVFGDEKLVGGLDCLTASWKSESKEDGFLEYQETSWDDMLCLGKGDTPREIIVKDINDYKNIGIVLNHRERHYEFDRDYFDGNLNLQYLSQDSGVPRELKVETSRLLDKKVGAWLHKSLYLVERGEVLTCEIKNQTRELPDVVVETCLLDHLKAKVFEIDEDRVAFYIMIEKRLVDSQNTELIKQGYERVAMARLADAQFFWNEDRKIKLVERIPLLDRQTWHHKLGSVGDKARRLKQLCLKIFTLRMSVEVTDDQIESAEEAGLISKSDLSSHMVIEYPSLQGIIGGFYAEREGSNDLVCRALQGLYGESDPKVGVFGHALYLADRIDTIVGMWSIGEKPSGSRDPFALRRAANQIIRLLQLLREKNLSIKRLLETSEEVWGDKIELTDKSEMMEYFRERIQESFNTKKVVDGDSGLLLEEGKFLLRVVVNRSGEHDLNIGRIDDTYNVLVDWLIGGKLSKLTEMARRVYGLVDNIQNSQVSNRDYNENLAIDPAEKELWKGIDELPPLEMNNKQGINKSMESILSLKDRLDTFCDKVMVNEEGAIGDNRKVLLGKLREYFDKLANFEMLIKRF